MDIFLNLNISLVNKRIALPETEIKDMVVIFTDNLENDVDFESNLNLEVDIESLASEKISKVVKIKGSY